MRERRRCSNCYYTFLFLCKTVGKYSKNDEVKRFRKWEKYTKSTLQCSGSMLLFIYSKKKENTKKECNTTVFNVFL